MPAAFIRSFAVRGRASQHSRPILSGKRPKVPWRRFRTVRFCSSEHSALRITHGRCDAVQDQPLRASGAALHVSAGTLPWRGCTPRPGTLIVYAPMHSASMPSPSYTLCAGPSQRAARESEVRIMFTGREGSRLGKVAPAERCIEGPDVGTCANSLANASP